jgi:hypothetical protein
LHKIVTIRLLKKKAEKELALKKRLADDEVYTLQRQKEYEEWLDKTHDIYSNPQSKPKVLLAIENRSHFELLENRRRIQHENNYKWIHDEISLQIAHLAFKVFLSMLNLNMFLVY